jgi:molybdopterin molybdotransferase
MTEFLTLRSPDEARRILLDHLRPSTGSDEDLQTAAALHRITAHAIEAPHDLPEFARSTVDGYALVARDTFGVTGAQPAYLRLIGEVPMGAAPAFAVAAGTCAIIHTGGMLPVGADAVVMLETAQPIGTSDPTAVPGGDIEILKTAAPGDNVIRAGEDVRAGEVVIQAGREIRAQEIGGLMALGILSVAVRARPRVAIISTGDEVVEPHLRPQPGQVRDVNGQCLAALVADHGCEPVLFGIVPDEPGGLLSAARRALDDCDMLVITAGSSASTRDLTATTIQSLGSPGVLVHGLSIRPGKPTILGVCEGKPVIGLPGNPVSAFVVARLFVLPAASRLQGRQGLGSPPTVPALLSVNLASQAGREDWWPVKLEADLSKRAHQTAVPVFGRSNLIFNLVSADGLVRIPPDANGLEAGELVQVQLL